jgi:ATP-dependent Clp endopeptidase proteolytic subunit ClpP
MDWSEPSTKRRKLNDGDYCALKKLPLPPLPNNCCNKASSIVERKENDIYYYAPVNKITAHKLIKEIRNINRDYEKLVNNNPILKNSTPTPIKLYIHSYGGGVDAAMSVIDVIRKSKIPVHTIIEGCAASAATMISVVGHKRYMGKHARILIHQLSSGVWGKFEEIKDHFDNSKKLMEIIKDIYQNYTNMSKNELRDILKRDLWWNADKCLKQGLIDEII